MNRSHIQNLALDKTHQLIESAENRYRIGLVQPIVRFDLRGKAAGMVLFKPGDPAIIRYNCPMLEQNHLLFLQQTVPHEVAHLVARERFGPGIKPHGREWRSIMQDFGVEAKRCHSFSTENTRTRKMRYFAYHCSCGVHKLSAVRHNRTLAGTTYLCRSCGTALVSTKTSLAVE